MVMPLPATNHFLEMVKTSARKTSFRNALLAIILALGAVSIALIISTSLYLRTLAHHNEIRTLHTIAELTLSNLLSDLSERSREFGYTLQKDETIRRHVRRPDPTALGERLEQMFFRYVTTFGLLRVQELAVYDRRYRLLARSRGGNTVERKVQCAGWPRQRAGLPLIEQLKTAERFCRDGSTPVLSVIVPLGGLRPFGFVQVSVDPVLNLSALEKWLGLPIRITIGGSEVTFVSDQWPAAIADSNYVYTSLPFHDPHGDTLLYEIELALNLEYFNRQSQAIMARLIVGSIALIFLVLAAAVLILRRGGRELSALQQASENITQGRYCTVPAAQYQEFSTLNRAFNRMVTNLSRRQQQWENDIATRTRDLQETNRQLRKEIEKQQTLEQIREEFYTVLHHDMRVPLSAVQDALQRIAARLSPLDDDERHLLSTAENHCARLHRLIEDIHTGHHLEKGPPPCTPAMTDIAPVVATLITEYRPLAQARKIEIEFQQETDRALLYIDCHRLRQILGNLLTRLIRQADAGQTVTVGLARREQRCLITVDAPVSGSTDGTGQAPDHAGLNFMQHLVQEMSGRFRCRSHSGHGICFEIEFAVYENSTTETLAE